MTFEPQSFAYLIGLARALAAQLVARDGLMDRPVLVRAAVMRRLATGVRLLVSFVRRLLVLMALSLEHGLVARALGQLARPHGRTTARRVQFCVLEAPCVYTIVAAAVDEPFAWADAARKPLAPAKLVSPARLYALLDQLAAIVADPVPRARRLAFALARRRPLDDHGLITPPEGPARIAGHWGMEVRASYEAMAAAILSASRARPPPLAPQRRAGPQLTCL